MSNMSYCRFRNTLSDLRDCQEAMDDTNDLSEGEALARERLIKLCVQIALNYGEVVGAPVEAAET